MVQMMFRAGPARDCATVGHDFRLTLATRVPRGSAVNQRRRATLLVTACSGCGERI